MMHVEMLLYYAEQRGIDWQWASLDSATVKAPKGGIWRARTRPTAPRAGPQRHVLTDGRGVPLAIVLTGANVHDKWMVGQTLDAVPLRACRAARRRNASRF
jgi:putative transposase